MKGEWKSRDRLFLGWLVFIFFLLLIRLFQLQVLQGNENRAIADGNRFRKESIPAQRGIIYDRTGRQLTRNFPLARVAKRDNEGQIVGWEIIDRETALLMEGEGKISDLRYDIGREYLFGPATAHVLGYLGEANEDEVKSRKYSLGDLLGRVGIEREYDSQLRGKDGVVAYEVDSLGRVLRTMGLADPVAGVDIHLSIDAELSALALSAMEDKPGAVVVSLAKTGEILALISSPGFDPSVFNNSSTLLLSRPSTLLTNPARPLFNRAIAGLYPPGSTFKIVTAAAGLETGKINKDTTFTDTGELRVGDFVYRNWYFTQYGRTEGEVNLVKAITRSNDIYFYKVGELIGPEALASWAKKFGLGEKTDIDIGGEAGGTVPDPEWKKQVLGERWFLGNTYHFAIGQDNLLTTPLQINTMTGVIANGGKWCRPTIIKNLEFRMQNVECRDSGLKAETIALIKEGMVGVCSTGGTAYPLFDYNIEGLPAGRRVACKTGTAQYSNKENKTHAWLTAFAPVDDPQVVVTVLVEGGGEGSAVAAPIARKVLEKYFSLPGV